MRGCGFTMLLLFAGFLSLTSPVCGLATIGIGIGLYLALRGMAQSQGMKTDPSGYVVIGEEDEETGLILELSESESAPRATVSKFLYVVTAFTRGVLNVIGSIIFVALFVGFAGGLPLFLKAENRDEGLVGSLMRSSTSDWSHPLVQMESKLAGFDGIQAGNATGALKLRQLFPDVNDYRIVIGWGRDLHAAWNRDAGNQGTGGFMPPAMLNDDVVASLVWRRLLCAPGSKEQDLFQLREIIESNIPPGTDRNGLYQWAERRAKESTPPLRRAKGIPLEQQQGYPPLPDLAFFRWWVIYEQWLPVPSMFEARLQDVLTTLEQPPSKFFRSPRNALLAWGEDITVTQREQQRILPPDGPNTYLLVATDQLIGRYNVGASLPIIERLLQSGSPLAVAAFYVLFPNDDVTALQFGGGFKEQYWDPNKPGLQNPYPPAMQRGEDSLAFFIYPIIIGVLLLGAIISRGMRFITIGVFATMIGIQQHPYKVAYSNAMRRRLTRWITTILIIGITYAATLLILEPFYVLYIRSSYRLILIVIWTTILGGVLIEGLRNIVTMMFIRFHINPLETIWDDLSAAFLGALLLWMFQNSWVAIIASVAVGLMPGIIYKIWARRVAR